MRRGVLFICALLAGLALPILPAAAEVSDGAPISQTITITGFVPEMRILYINNDGYLVKVVGNTSRNVEPAVLTLDNKPAALSEGVKQQYHDFMAQHNWHLDASVEYPVNPVSVSASISGQTISLAASASSQTILVQPDTRLAAAGPSAIQTINPVVL